MDILVEQEAGQCRIAVNGEMTIYTAAEVREKLLVPIANCRDTEIEVDLANVTDMDTAGQQLLIAAKIASVARRNSLRLVRHSPAVLEVLDLYGLGRFFGDPVLMQRPSE
jgi:anti-anti-sigma factor